MSYARPFLLSFRARQAQLFDSTVTLTRHTGYEDGPGRSVEATTETVYEGPGQVLKPEAVHRTETIGDEPVEVSSYQATIPHHVLVERGDFVTVEESFDPDLVGRTFRVVEVRRSEWLVHRRLRLETT